MGETESLLAISCHQTKLAVPDLGYSLSCCSKMSRRNPQTSQTAAKSVGSPQTDHISLLLKIIPTQHIEYGNVELVSIESFHLTFQIFWYRKHNLS